MGDAVNLASRLEGANRFFGTSIIASENTVALAGSTIVWRELDFVRVKGRAEAVLIFEPIAISGAETEDQIARTERHGEGLALWRVGDFAAAAAMFARFADVDPPSARVSRKIEKNRTRPAANELEAYIYIGVS